MARKHKVQSERTFFQDLKEPEEPCMPFEKFWEKFGQLKSKKGPKLRGQKPKLCSEKRILEIIAQKKYIRDKDVAGHDMVIMRSKNNDIWKVSTTHRAGTKHTKDQDVDSEDSGDADEVSRT